MHRQVIKVRSRSVISIKIEIFESHRICFHLGWGSKSAARNVASVLDADVTSTAPNVLKPSAGRVIRIVNNLDHNVQVKWSNLVK